MTKDNSGLMKLTSGVIAAFGIIIKIGMGILVAVMIGLPLMWDKLVTEYAAQHPGESIVGYLPAILVALAIGLAILFLMTRILAKLDDIIDSVREGDPFNPINAGRLRSIGWLILGMEAVGAIGGLAGAWFATVIKHGDIGYGLSLSGLLSALLCFVLAIVFDHGTQLRAEVEGTV